MRMWEPLLIDQVKLNFDGCSKGNLVTTTTGVLINHYKGRDLEAYVKCLRIATNVEAKSIASQRGIKRLKELGFTKSIIEGDSKLIVKSLSGQDEPTQKIKSMIQDYKQ